MVFSFSKISINITLKTNEDISVFQFQVFICGPYPHWLFMTQRGSLRIHPMGIDGAITCFAPFHNVNCPKGFLYFNKQVRVFEEIKYITSDMLPELCLAFLVF